MWPGCMIGVTSAITAALPRRVVSFKVSPVLQFSDAASAGLRRSAPYAPFLCHDASRTSVFMVSPRRSPADRMKGYSASRGKGSQSMRRSSGINSARYRLMRWPGSRTASQLSSCSLTAKMIPDVFTRIASNSRLPARIGDPPKPASAAAFGLLRTYSCATPQSDAAGSSPGGKVGPSVRYNTTDAWRAMRGLRADAQPNASANARWPSRAARRRGA